ncbi:histone H2A-like [Impatiens glandulifera]|uniref:histone H2A-like n=1 Tax=Impatiens glandulifera TaxID=253017 RepID=UPI001FB0B170|nr:histone H2A-like [Impatiens glandulifera]
MDSRGEVKRVGGVNKNKVGLQFLLTRIRRNVGKGRQIQQIDAAAAVYLGVVLEYLTTEVLESAGNLARGSSKKVIESKHLLQAAKNDKEELGKLLAGVITDPEHDLDCLNLGFKQIHLHDH